MPDAKLNTKTNPSWWDSKDSVPLATLTAFSARRELFCWCWGGLIDVYGVTAWEEHLTDPTGAWGLDQPHAAGQEFEKGQHNGDRGRGKGAVSRWHPSRIHGQVPRPWEPKRWSRPGLGKNTLSHPFKLTQGHAAAKRCSQPCLGCRPHSGPCSWLTSPHGITSTGQVLGPQGWGPAGKASLLFWAAVWA